MTVPPAPPAPPVDQQPPSIPPDQAPVDWRASLPEDIRGEKSIEQYKTLPDFVKGFVETKKMVGQALRAPAADAPDEEWEKFYRAGGAPEKPDEYKFNIPAEISVPPEVEQRLRHQAHKMRLNGRQTQQMINEYAKEYLEDRRLAKQATNEVSEKFQQEWGGNYKRNMALIDRALDQIDPDKSLRLVLNESGAMYHPAIIKHFHEYSKRLVEGGLMQGDVDGVVGREEARAKIAALTPAWQASKPGDPIREEMTRLHQLAFD
jgi:hypothetical protein